MIKEIKNSFIPIERGALPRILLIDFNEEIFNHLQSLGYNVVAGYSGLGKSKLYIPKHASEVEIVIWDISDFDADGKFFIGDYQCDIRSALERLEERIAFLSSYFSRIIEKEGFITVLLNDDKYIAHNIISRVVNKEFTLKDRITSTLRLTPNIDGDLWYIFLKRFVSESNIKFSISWNDNMVGLERYFEDEDDKFYSFVYGQIAVIPKIEDNNKKSAITFLLQDILPGRCGQDIFPDECYYLWANKSIYLPEKVNELKKINEKIKSDVDSEIEKNISEIESEIEKDNYLVGMLVSDDSDLFPDGKKLSDFVNVVLQDDFGFIVTDVDKMKLALGQSLKEDKWLEDSDGYFSLVEIKGTENGAKANWIRTDLNAHIKEFEVVKEITGLTSLLIFNHQRRVDPEDRGRAFDGDPDLIKYCEKSNIGLIPVYELFKMVRDIKNGTLSKDEARKKIKNAKGLFIYS